MSVEIYIRLVFKKKRKAAWVEVVWCRLLSEHLKITLSNLGPCWCSGPDMMGFSSRSVTLAPICHRQSHHRTLRMWDSGLDPVSATSWVRYLLTLSWEHWRGVCVSASVCVFFLIVWRLRCSEVESSVVLREMLQWQFHEGAGSHCREWTCMCLFVPVWCHADGFNDCSGGCFWFFVQTVTATQSRASRGMSQLFQTRMRNTGGRWWTWHGAGQFRLQATFVHWWCLPWISPPLARWVRACWDISCPDSCRVSAGWRKGSLELHTTSKHSSFNKAYKTVRNATV